MYLGAKFPNKQRNNAEDVPLIGHLKESLNLVHDYNVLNHLNAIRDRRVGRKKKKATLESEKIDWEKLRKEIYATREISRAPKVPDKVDWDAVLHESSEVVAKTIACRGQQLNITHRIQVISHTYFTL